MFWFNLNKKLNSITEHFTFKKVLEFLKHYVLGLFKRIDDHNLFLSGAGIAFSLFLGMIPFILLIFSLLGNIFDAETLQAQIFQIVDTIIPYPVYAEYAKQVIRTRLPEVIVYKTAAGYIGVFGLLFTSTWIFSSLRTILNQIFHTHIQKSAFVGLLRDIGMVILLVFFITLSTFVLPAMNILIKISDDYTLLGSLNISTLWDTIFWISSLVILFIMFFALYYLIPYAQLPKRVALLGAFWTTLLWEIARSLFGYYVRGFLSTSALYGAFILIVVILLWVFYSSCIFIIGAEIGQLYRERLIIKKSIKDETTSSIN